VLRGEVAAAECWRVESDSARETFSVGFRVRAGRGEYNGAGVSPTGGFGSAMLTSGGGADNWEIYGVGLERCDESSKSSCSFSCGCLGIAVGKSVFAVLWGSRVEGVVRLMDFI